MLENGRRLATRYPHYNDLVQDFIRRDPLSEIRGHAWDRLMQETNIGVSDKPQAAGFWRRWIARLNDRNF
jgi:hypothetical protein